MSLQVLLLYENMVSQKLIRLIIFIVPLKVLNEAGLGYFGCLFVYLCCTIRFIEYYDTIFILL